jgi:hypothetical protein
MSYTLESPNEDPLYPFAIHDFFHELMPEWQGKTSTGYPSPSDDTSLLDGHYIVQSVSEEVFPDDIENAKEVH